MKSSSLKYKNSLNALFISQVFFLWLTKWYFWFDSHSFDNMPLCQKSSRNSDNELSKILPIIPLGNKCPLFKIIQFLICQIFFGLMTPTNFLILFNNLKGEKIYIASFCLLLIEQFTLELTCFDLPVKLVAPMDLNWKHYDILVITWSFLGNRGGQV